MFYDSDIVVTGEYDCRDKTTTADALESYNEGATVSLEYRPIKEVLYKEESGYSMYQCVLNEDDEFPPEFTMIGFVSDHLDIGHTFTSDGTIVVRAGKKQFKIHNMKSVYPNCPAGVLSFARTLDGIRSGADLLFEEFGADMLRVIETDMEAVRRVVPGSYDEQIEVWRKQIRNTKDELGFMSELVSIGLTPRQARQLMEKYGADTLVQIRTNPYCLMGKVNGYTFAKCDEAASKLEVEPDGNERLEAGITTAVRMMMMEGSTKVRLPDILAAGVDILTLRMTVASMQDACESSATEFVYAFGSHKWKISVDKIKKDFAYYKQQRTQKDRDTARTLVWQIPLETVEAAIDSLLTDGVLVSETDEDGTYIWLSSVYREEVEIASAVAGIQAAVVHDTGFDAEQALNAYCRKHGIELEQRQREAVLHICSGIGGLHIINGAAGCGKTFCIKIALAILEQMFEANNMKLRKVIVAPTGKAARVAYKSTGIPSFTIHKLLGNNADGTFAYCASNKLDYNCIVIDETSMLDTHIAYTLLAAIASDSVVIMMGDTNQLPSIGAGNVLHDLIDCGLVDLVTLNVIKRQGTDSGIVINARNIISGQMVTTQREQMDSIIIGAQNDAEAVEKMKKYVRACLESYDLADIQILSPMKKGMTGTHYINYVMQSEYNPSSGGVEFPKVKFSVGFGSSAQELQLNFRIGDRVINTKNDYSAVWYQVDDSGTLFEDEQERTGITNGEVGNIVYLGKDKDANGDSVNRMIVQYEDKYIVYDNEFDHLELAYCITIHRSQGSEWPAVIVMLSPNHKRMEDRSLFYTGLTRSKKKAIVISDADTLKCAVSLYRAAGRTTGLADRLKEMLS